MAHLYVRMMWSAVRDLETMETLPTTAWVNCSGAGPRDPGMINLNLLYTARALETAIDLMHSVALDEIVILKPL